MSSTVVVGSMRARKIPASEHEGRWRCNSCGEPMSSYDTVYMLAIPMASTHIHFDLCFKCKSDLEKVLIMVGES